MTYKIETKQDLEDMNDSERIEVFIDEEWED